MKPDDSAAQSAADLTALSAAAHGQVMPRRVKDTVAVAAAPPDAEREARIAELKLKYEAGELVLDEKALVSKLVDLLFDTPPPPPGAGN